MSNPFIKELPTDNLPSMDDQVLGTLPDADPHLIAGDTFSGASAFEAMLEGNDPIPTESDEDSSNEEQPDVDAEDENESEQHEDSDEEQPDGDDGEEVDQEDGDEEAPATELTDETVVQDANGEDVTIAELKTGNLRQADYTRGKQELADQRKELEGNVLMFTENLTIASSETADALAQYDKVDWAKLSPTDYQKHQVRVTDLKKKQGEQRGMFQKIQSLNEQQNSVNKQTQIKETFATLNKELPTFNKRVYKDIRDHAVNDLGVDAQIVNGIADAKILIALHNSMLYTQGKKGVATKTVPKNKSVRKTQQSKGKATPSRNKKPQKAPLIQKGQYSSDAGRSAFEALL